MVLCFVEFNDASCSRTALEALQGKAYSLIFDNFRLLTGVETYIHIYVGHFFSIVLTEDPFGSYMK